MSNKAEIMKAVEKCKDRHTLYTCPHETEPYIGLSDLEAILDKHLPEQEQGVEEWIDKNIQQADLDIAGLVEGGIIEQVIIVSDLKSLLSSLPLLPEGYMAVPKWKLGENQGRAEWVQAAGQNDTKS